MWVVHEKPFPKQIRWAEYDGDDHVITLIDADGTPHPLGVKIHPDYKPTLLMAKRLMIACVAENELKAIDLIPVTVRNIDF